METLRKKRKLPGKGHRRKRYLRCLSRVENLEPRLNLSAGWQNLGLPCDVNDSGVVTALDAHILINEINRVSSRQLTVLPRSPGSPFWDVNGDDSLSPIDALVVINALNQFSHPLGLTVNVSPEDDKNGNGVLVQPMVSLVGQAAAGSRISIRVDNLAGSAAFDTFDINSSGLFRQQVTLSKGVNEIHTEARDELGRTTSNLLTLVKGDAVTDWNAAVLNVVRDWTTISNDPYPGRIVAAQPPLVARNLAMIHAAMFDAANGFDRTYQPYLTFEPSPEGASQIAAIASAGYTVATALYADVDELAVWRATLDESLASEGDLVAAIRGIAYGNLVGLRMLAERQHDGLRNASSYVPSGQVGEWRRTFPDYLPPLLPQWPTLKPFAIDSVSSYRPSAPPLLSSDEYAAAVDQVAVLGALVGSERTEDQTQSALFWADGGGTATPPGHWNRIASSILAESSGALLESARVLALLNLALADAGIAAWDAKYAYDMWRPIDAIREADGDGNALTASIDGWLPLLKTPPFPTYTSGHSTFSGAAAAVLTSIYGDSFAFESTSDAHTGYSQRPLASDLVTSRSFSSFDQAATEAGMSRIYGGIHFDFDNTAGLAVGKSVGFYVVENWLRPESVLND